QQNLERLRGELDYYAVSSQDMILWVEFELRKPHCAAHHVEHHSPKHYRKVIPFRLSEQRVLHTLDDHSRRGYLQWGAAQQFGRVIVITRPGVGNLRTLAGLGLTLALVQTGGTNANSRNQEIDETSPRVHPLFDFTQPETGAFPTDYF